MTEEETCKIEERLIQWTATMVGVGLLFMAAGLVTLYFINPPTITILTDQGPKVVPVKPEFYSLVVYLIKKGVAISGCLLILLVAIVSVGVKTGVKLWRLRNEIAIAIVAAAIFLVLGFTINSA